MTLFKLKIFLTIFSLGMFSFNPSLLAYETEGQVWQNFSAFDPQSEGVIDHEAWTIFLENTVMPVGRSTRVLGYSRKSAYRLSKIKYGNNSPSRFEGNRLLAHLLEKSDKRIVRNYLKNLEALPQRVPLAWLNKDQQLAFWLNLYNAAVIDKVIEEYPISSLKALRGKEGQGSFWYEKILEVEGIPLSLRDIENILINNWENPLIIYGLWQGAIGGPTLSSEAYTGDNVWKILRYQAFEFVNSNRGVRIKGNEAEISIFYDWMAAAFDQSEDNIIRHIRQLADHGFLPGANNITSATPAYYDWTIADLIGGTYHSGQSLKGTANAGAGNAVAGGPVVDFALRGIPPIPVSERYPPQAINLIKGILKNNDIPERIPVITTEECAPGEACGATENPES